MMALHGEWATVAGSTRLAQASGGLVGSIDVMLLVGLAVLVVGVLVAFLVSRRSAGDKRPPGRWSAGRPGEQPSGEQRPGEQRPGEQRSGGDWWADSAPAQGSRLTPYSGFGAGPRAGREGTAAPGGVDHRDADHRDADHRDAPPADRAAPPLARRRPTTPPDAFSAPQPVVGGARHRAEDPPLSMLSNQATLGGQVLGPEGQPVVGAVLTVTDFHGSSVGAGRSANDGRYRLHLPTGGTYLLVCAAEGHQSTTVMVTVAGATLACDVVLGGAGGIDGWIRHQYGGPAAGATVTLTDLRGEVVAAVIAGPGGGYQLGGLNAGEYTLVATAPGAQPTACTVEVPASGAHQVDLVLQSNGALRGTVRSANGARPVPEAAVALVDGDGALVAVTVAGPDGEYVFAEVSPGGYTLIAAGYAPVAVPIELTGQRTEVCDVVLGAPPDAGSPANPGPHAYRAGQ